MKSADKNNNGRSDEGRACRATKQDGSPCRTRPIKGSTFCFFHDPAKASDREAAQRRGGERNQSEVLPPDAKDFNIDNWNDYLKMLVTMINYLLKGKVGTKRVAVFYPLAALVGKALENANVQQQLATLEPKAETFPPPDGLYDPNEAEEEQQEEEASDAEEDEEDK